MIFLVGKYAHAHATISHTYDWKNITSCILALNTLIITRKYINQREDKNQGTILKCPGTAWVPFLMVEVVVQGD